MSVAVSFGRSRTVPTTAKAAHLAPPVIALDQVSITGGEYPALYGATAHVHAEMLSFSGFRLDTTIERDVATSRPPLILEAGSVDDSSPDVLVERVDVRASSAPVPEWSCQVKRSGWPGASRVSASDVALKVIAAEENAFRLLWAQQLLIAPAASGAITEFRTETAPSLVDLAEEVGAIPVPTPSPVELSGNLTRDVLALTGLTAAELGSVVGRTERSVRKWIAEDQTPAVPTELLQRLRTIALRVVGGLGSSGARRWLMAGHPSPLELIAAGRTADVVAETERLLDSPAT